MAAAKLIAVPKTKLSTAVVGNADHAVTSILVIDPKTLPLSGKPPPSTPHIWMSTVPLPPLLAHNKLTVFSCLRLIHLMKFYKVQA